MSVIFAFFGALSAGEAWAKLIAWALAAVAAVALAWFVFDQIKDIGRAELAATINQKNQEAGDAAQKGRDAAERRINTDPARGLCDAWTRDCAR